MEAEITEPSVQSPFSPKSLQTHLSAWVFPIQFDALHVGSYHAMDAKQREGRS